MNQEQTKSKGFALFFLGIFVGGIMLLLLQALEISDVGKSENNLIIRNVSNAVLVNKNEKPTVVSVNDRLVASIVTSGVFSSIEDEDKFIVYSDKAILYRPSIKKVLYVVNLVD